MIFSNLIHLQICLTESIKNPSNQNLNKGFGDVE
jgi:hypothetical protein